MVHADPPPASTADKQWTITPFIKGTTDQVRDLINGPLEQQMARKADLVRQHDQRKAALDAKTAALTASLRKSSPTFVRAEADLASAKSALQSARSNGDASARIAAQDRVTSAAAAVQSQLDAAAAADPTMAEDRKAVAELQRSAAAVDGPIATAANGRTQFLDAFRLTLAIPGPPADGAKGFLNKLKMVKVLDAHTFIAQYEAVERVKEVQDPKTADGAKTFAGRAYVVKLVVTNTDTAPLAGKKTFDLDHTYQLKGTRVIGQQKYLVAEPVEGGGPYDPLFAVLDDLRVPPAAAR